VHLLGRPAFNALATDYLCDQPSRHWSLVRLGVGLPAFQAAQAAPDACLQQALNLDLAFLRAFDVPDAPLLDPASLDEAALATAVLPLHPSATLLQEDWALMACRQALREGAEPPALQRQSGHWLVLRGPDGQVRAQALEPEALPLLEGLQQGRPLGDVLDTLAADPATALLLVERLQDWFASWSGYGLFVCQPEDPAHCPP
jgi:hypothetical protein